jgi:hypothetical protein
MTLPQKIAWAKGARHKFVLHEVLDRISVIAQIQSVHVLIVGYAIRQLTVDMFGELVL